ncbi:upstream activation factor subunit UAF30-like [Typha angustifolia]|uniref:upstream activation factor subunit UAF30-like n=1 Tax=Typha angustifolia TaxID=59011 RepID=UPI003C3016FD
MAAMSSVGVALRFSSAFFRCDLPVPPHSAVLPRHRTALPTVVLRAAASSKAAETKESEVKRKPRGITKPRPVSPAMQALVGVPEIPRTQALKLIWAHIKKNNLQDPEDKKIIVCDEKLKNIFGGRERVGFLEISGLLNPHFGK